MATAVVFIWHYMVSSGKEFIVGSPSPTQKEGLFCV